MDKEYRNALLNLSLRELGVKSNYRRNTKILRNFYLSNDCKYKKVFERHSRYPIAYEGNKLYLNNYRSCYYVSGIGGNPSLLYDLPQGSKSDKIEDVLICQSVLEDIHIYNEKKDYRPCVLGIKANNWLVQYDSDNGQVLQQIFLSTQCRFKTIGWETDLRTVAIKSVRQNQSRMARQLGGEQRVVLTIAVFSIFPLEFIGMMEIDRKVFGKDVINALIADGLLITMHQGGKVKLHSFHHVLTEGLLYSAKLGDFVDGHGVVGGSGDGLPINIKLEESPPVLFEVACAEHNFQVGGLPWHYIICPAGKHGIFQVHSLSTGYLAHDGILDSDTLSIEPDKAMFHPDGSNKIIHIGANEARILKIGELNEKTRRHNLVKCYNVKPWRETEQTPVITHTLSGRKIQRKHFSKEIMDSASETIHSIDYENELDILIAPVFRPIDFEKSKGRILFYDNESGKALNPDMLVFEESWKEFGENLVTVDMDTVIHIVKCPTQRYSCYIYQLDRCLDKEDVTLTKKKTKKSQS